MNTNGNLYTVIYSTLIVIVVATILAWAATGLAPRQKANIKAETISQMLTAAGFATKDELAQLPNDDVLRKYTEYIESAYLIQADGTKTADLESGKEDIRKIELADKLKFQDKLIRKGGKTELPVYVFNKEGKKVTVLPVFGPGLWGPVWGYLAFDEDLRTIIGAYFDHESETPGLGAKIKDDPAFRAEFRGKKIDLADKNIFSIVKGGAPAGKENAIDAITGATMTSMGLEVAINNWLAAYRTFLAKHPAEGNGSDAAATGGTIAACVQPCQ